MIHRLFLRKTIPTHPLIMALSICNNRQITGVSCEVCTGKVPVIDSPIRKVEFTLASYPYLPGIETDDDGALYYAPDIRFSLSNECQKPKRGSFGVKLMQQIKGYTIHIAAAKSDNGTSIKNIIGARRYVGERQLLDIITHILQHAKTCKYCMKRLVRWRDQNRMNGEILIIDRDNKKVKAVRVEGEDICDECSSDDDYSESESEEEDFEDECEEESEVDEESEEDEEDSDYTDSDEE